jgi:hypothetical protein
MAKKRPLLCRVARQSLFRATLVSRTVTKPLTSMALPCGVARQSLCHENSCTKKSYFPVVLGRVPKKYSKSPLRSLLPHEPSAHSWAVLWAPHSHPPSPQPPMVVLRPGVSPSTCGGSLAAQRSKLCAGLRVLCVSFVGPSTEFSMCCAPSDMLARRIPCSPRWRSPTTNLVSDIFFC